MTWIITLQANILLITSSICCNQSLENLQNWQSLVFLREFFRGVFIQIYIFSEESFKQKLIHWSKFTVLFSILWNCADKLSSSKTEANRSSHLVVFCRNWVQFIRSEKSYLLSSKALFLLYKLLLWELLATSANSGEINSVSKNTRRVSDTASFHRSIQTLSNF